eukprot:6297935-Prymnesium_polylepis.1
MTLEDRMLVRMPHEGQSGRCGARPRARPQFWTARVHGRRERVRRRGVLFHGLRCEAMGGSR